MPTAIRSLAPALAFAALLGSAALADQAVSYSSLLTPLFHGGKTVLGQQVVYPTGSPANLTAAIVTLPPGAQTGWHTHEVPLFVHILEGEVTVDYGEKGIKVFRKGDSAIEAVDWAHNGMNKGTVPVRMIAVYIGAEGVSNATPVSR